ncbi:MAG: protein kinase domain-containing protein [Anaerobutyricum hallii]
MKKNLHYLRKETRLIGRYTIKSVLGQGGFGITYLGMDELYQRKVAIKEFFPQGIVTRNTEYEDTVTVTYVEEKADYEKGKERFLKEARTMAKFSKNEGIVKVLDFFEINNTAYIVMEYLEGITLKQYIRENQRITLEELVRLLVPLIESLDEIHSQGMIHRDISPDNIMVLPDGRIKLMDFGAARDYTKFGEKTLSIVLKPGYAPPEQYQTHGIQGPWTDIYALCATMYKCITGETPPDAIDRVIDDHLKKISEFGITIPPQIESVIIKGMSVSAKDRYQDIKDFCEDLYGGYEEIPASENEEIEIEQVLIKENVENKVKKKTSVQEVKSKTDNKKYRQQKKLSGKAVLAVILCILLVGGGVKLYSDKREQQIAEQKKQQYTLHNPKIEDDSSAKSRKKVTWDCLWFGSYPQSQITKKDGEIYTTLKNADNWDKNGDVTINNIKYHKTEAGYFKYEPIKWRVLQSENGEAFLLSDVILDKQAYNENDEYITWKESSLRAWLNDKFMNRAFSDEEKEKINITEVVNKDNPVFGTKGGKNTSDKIFLLSLAEVSRKKGGKKYGLLDDWCASRQVDN